MTEIHFLIEQEKFNDLTWEEFDVFEMAQEGTVKLKDIRPLIARFMVNGDGRTQVPFDDAVKILKKLPMGKVREALELFMETVKNTAVPKANGSQLKQPTEAGSTDSPSLDG